MPLKSTNQVALSGRLSRKGSLRYTPGGLAVLELVVTLPDPSDPQRMEYFPVSLQGEFAVKGEEISVGEEIQLIGHLKMRTFVNQLNQPVEKLEIIGDRFQIVFEPLILEKEK